jgi:single-stranded-DNA-specific exonuclease
VNRGFTTQAAIDEFLEPDYGDDLHDPFLFRQMERAVDRIITAIEKNERIVVYGDYDADGVSGAAILTTTLEKLGAQVGVYIPYRQTEGYGLNVPAVESLHAEGYRLLITNDCGITSAQEVDRANELDMDVIISDHHHEPPQLPKAYAILNPKVAGESYPFSDLCGTGVSFKLAYALLLRTNYGETLKRVLPAGWEKWLLDLVAIATIADMMPLRGENRTLVSYGLRVLRKTQRPGLRALFDVMRCDAKSADTETIGFQIAPRLNAAGRLDHANAAYRLLVTDDDAEARTLAADLEAKNRERQQLTEQVVNGAIEQVGDPGDRPLIAAYSPDWPIGVLGLAAGKLTNRFHRPALVMGQSNGEILGSGRSIPAFNIIEGIEAVRDQFLSKAGGHSQACGFTLKKNDDREAFVAALAQLAGASLEGKSLTPEMTIDAALEAKEVNWKLLEVVETLAPYGQTMPRPVFAIRDVEVMSAMAVGRDQRHLRLTIRSKDGTIQKTIGFSFGEELAKLPVGRIISLAVEVGADEWNGERRLQLKIHDVDYGDQNHNPD